MQAEEFREGAAALPAKMCRWWIEHVAESGQQ
jgi:hypothetical protein